MSEARRFFVEVALKAAHEIKGQGEDWIHLGIVQGALEHLLERWDEWGQVEQGGVQQLSTQGGPPGAAGGCGFVTSGYIQEVNTGGPDGQADVGAGSSETGGEVRGGTSGGGDQDVSTGNAGEHAGPTGAEGGYEGCERRQHTRYPHLDTITGGLFKLAGAILCCAALEGGWI